MASYLQKLWRRLWNMIFCRRSFTPLLNRRPTTR
jgi:hypothetical protein